MRCNEHIQPLHNNVKYVILVFDKESQLKEKIFFSNVCGQPGTVVIL